MSKKRWEQFNQRFAPYQDPLFELGKGMAQDTVQATEKIGEGMDYIEDLRKKGVDKLGRALNIEHQGDKVTDEDVGRALAKPFALGSPEMKEHSAAALAPIVGAGVALATDPLNLIPGGEAGTVVKKGPKFLKLLKSLGKVEDVADVAQMAKMKKQWELAHQMNKAKPSDAADLLNLDKKIQYYTQMSDEAFKKEFKDLPMLDRQSLVDRLKLDFDKKLREQSSQLGDYVPTSQSPRDLTRDPHSEELQRLQKHAEGVDQKQYEKEMRELRDLEAQRAQQELENQRMIEEWRKANQQLGPSTGETTAILPKK